MNQLRAGAALAYVNLAAGNVLALVVTPLMLRSLGQAEFGLYSLVGAFVAYVAVLDFGLGNAVVRYAAKFRAERDPEKEGGFLALCLRLYGAIAVASIAVGALVHANLGALFSRTMGAEDLAQGRRLFALMILNLAISFPLGAYAGIVNAHERFVFLRAVNLARAFLRTGVLVLLLLLGHRALAIVLLDTALNVAAGALNVHYVHARLGLRARRYAFEPGFLRELLAYSGFVFLNVLVDQLYWRIGHVVLGAVDGARTVAVFAIAIQFTSYYMQFPMAVGSVFLPRVTAMVVGGAGSGELLALFARTARIQLIVLLYVLGGFVLCGREFIALWAGAEYRDAWAAALVMMVPLTVPLAQTLGLHILQAKNMHRFRSVAYLAIALVNVGVSVALARRWGTLGAAAATAASLVVGNVVVINLYYHLRVGLDMRRFLRLVARGIVPAALAATALAAAALALPASSWLGLALRAAVFTAAFAAAMWRVGMNDDERDLVRGALAWLVTPRPAPTGGAP